MTDDDDMSPLMRVVMAATDDDDSRSLHIGTVRALILAEREACAKIAETTPRPRFTLRRLGTAVATAIRARSDSNK